MKSDLFEPCQVGALRLKNRIAMAPMTRSRATAEGVPTSLMAEYYAQRAEAGLIVSEGTNISAQGQGFVGTPGIFDAAQVAGWRQVTQRLRGSNTLFFLQLWHVGRISHPDNMAPGLEPVAPSAIAHDRTVVTPHGLQSVPRPRALSLDEIGQTIADYANAARHAIEAGCDGVEIHAANGYLPSQFLHESANLRRDGYGGSIEARARFLIEVTQACVKAIGAEGVGVRLTPFSVFNGASSTDDRAVYRHLLPALAELGIAYLHVVKAEVAGNQTVELHAGDSVPDVLAFVRPLWPGVLVAAGNYDLKDARADVAGAHADLIAFGRDFIGNPDLVTRLREQRALAERKPADWYGSGRKGYTDYPRADAVQPARVVAL